MEKYVELLEKKQWLSNGTVQILDNTQWLMLKIQSLWPAFQAKKAMDKHREEHEADQTAKIEKDKKSRDSRY